MLCVVAVIPDGVNNRGTSLSTDECQEIQAGVLHKKPQPFQYLHNDILFRKVQVYVWENNKEEKAKVLNSQVQVIDSKGIPLDLEAKKPEDDLISHQRKQADEQRNRHDHKYRNQFCVPERALSYMYVIL